MHCILEQIFFSGPKTEIKGMDQFLNYHKILLYVHTKTRL